MPVAFITELLIIGGGLLGSCAAMLSAEDGRKTLLYRRQDKPTPHAESQRNQAWHQSGLHYSFGPDMSAARLMRRAGKVLLDEFQFAAPPRGFMRLAAQDASVIEERARMLGVAVRQHTAPSLMGALRGCYRGTDGATYWEVPDGPFPEADAIALARNRARNAGANLREIQSEAHLQADADSPCGVAAIIDGMRIGAAGILIAAGAGTPNLLADLELPDMFEVVQTPLLLVTRDDVMRAPLLVDRVQGYAITQPIPGRLTYGIPLHRKLIPGEQNARYVGPPEQQKLMDSFQAHTGVSLTAGEFRFDAGFEIWARGAKGIEKFMPIIESHPRFPGVTWALPGRATMALAAAAQALERFEPTVVADTARSAELPGHAWDGPVAMYYEGLYDQCNDGEVTEEES